MALPLPQLLKIMVDEGGTDLHITSNSPPLIRVHGILKRIEHPTLSPAETKQLIYSILNDNHIANTGYNLLFLYDFAPLLFYHLGYFVD